MRDPHIVPVDQNTVDLVEPVAGLREVDVLRRQPRLEQGSLCSCDIVRVPDQRHLDPCGLLRDALERLPAEEVVVEGDAAAVTEVVGRDVVVLDPLGGEASGQGSGAGCGKPVEVPFRVGPGEDGRQGRGNPRGFEIRRGVRLGSDPHEPERLSFAQQRVPDALALFPRAEQLEAGLTGHSVTQ